MTEIQMSNKETADHIRKWALSQHGPFAWPTDGCGYNQSVRFAQYRNENWDNSSLDSKAFLLDYADKIEKEPDTLCLCIHPNEKLGMSKVGCASHSDAGKAEQRIKDVIAKLEKDLKVGVGAYHKSGRHEQEYWKDRIEEALALLRGKEE